VNSPTSDSRNSRVVAIINGKGGVGKTSLTANVGGQLAKAGVRVLLVDLCSQGNLGLDLGYIGEKGADEGWATVTATLTGSDLITLSGGRPNLDVVPGGKHLSVITSQQNVAAVAATFADRLGALASGYDLALIDCSPVNETLQALALAAARYVMIPTKTDPASWDGLRRVGPMVKAARNNGNPQITYLGSVIFGHTGAATRVKRSTRARLDEVADTVPMFETSIRYSEAAAHDARLRGQLIHELALDSRRAQKSRLSWLGQKQSERAPIAEEALTNPSTLKPLADEYLRLSEEIVARIANHERYASEGARS